MDCDQSVINFQKYLRINTALPDPKYGEAVELLREIGAEIGLEAKVLEVHQGFPILVLEWQGLDSSLPAVLLNSHMDVVPVFPEFWDHDPFGAVKDDRGDIYGRGSQDMKCVGIQYLEALRRMIKRGERCKRTIFLSYVPDEELNGEYGMQTLIVQDTFKSMNVAVALDEGLASENDTYMVYNGERDLWWLKVTCRGSPGHGSKFIASTAAEKLRKMINFLLDLREQEKAKLESCPQLSLGDVTTVNLTKIEGGVQTNVVPVELSAWFDIRIPPTLNIKEFELQLQKWADQCDGGVTLDYEWQAKAQLVSPINDDDIWWNAISATFKEINEKFKVEIFTGGTDSQFLRMIGIPAYGFSPMVNTPVLLHDHNERLNENVFLRGIEIYEKLIWFLGNA